MLSDPDELSGIVLVLPGCVTTDPSGSVSVEANIMLNDSLADLDVDSFVDPEFPGRVLVRPGKVATEPSGKVDTEGGNVVNDAIWDREGPGKVKVCPRVVTVVGADT